MMLTSRNSGGTGDSISNNTASLENRLTTRCKQLHKACLGYRQEGWIPPTRRIGEARKPGPSTCSANPGHWSRID
eukprot:3744192-Amphidinium_carterae.1